MSLERYFELRDAENPAARHYLETNFQSLFAEAAGNFTQVGYSVIFVALLLVLLSAYSWFRLRDRLPWLWFWLIPLVGFTLYAGIKSSVIYELIQRAPDLPQMWQLYFKFWTPIKMIRTSATGLLLTTTVMWVVASWWSKRHRDSE